MKRWGLGTYHGLRRKHVDSYLNEFVFRYNRRFYRHVSFEILLGIASHRRPVGYWDIAGRENPGKGETAVSRGIAFGRIACKVGREGFLGRPRFGMEARGMEGFSGIFSQLEDPRTGNARRHDLCEVLVIALCSCLCGGTTCTEMAEFAEDKEPFLREFLTLKNGLPSHDTFSRLFRLLDPAAFGACFSEFMRAFSRQTAGVVAVDGKTLRRSFDAASEKSALHMVSAWSCEERLVLAQIATDEKSNEISAVPQLLRLGHGAHPGWRHLA
jgi:hypothetical protein